MRKWLDSIFNFSSTITCLDDDWVTKSVAEKIEELEERILKLEDENISLTNELYRLENSLDARIDMLAIENHINETID